MTGVARNDAPSERRRVQLDRSRIPMPATIRGQPGATRRIRRRGQAGRYGMKYGDQLPALPVLSYDSSRLLPQTFRVVLLESGEIDGLSLHAGRFTAQNDNNHSGRDVPGRELDSIELAGATYAFSDQLSATLYFSDIEAVARKRRLAIAACRRALPGVRLRFLPHPLRPGLHPDRQGRGQPHPEHDGHLTLWTPCLHPRLAALHRRLREFRRRRPAGHPRLRFRLRRRR